jgi:hypothetical protein
MVGGDGGVRDGTCFAGYCIVGVRSKDYLLDFTT